MPMVNAVIALALLEYMIFALLVGRARGKYGVAAPAVAGNEMFERYYRVQMNTLEQLIVFVPAMWMFGQFVSEPWAAGLGVAFIIGRALYLQSYIADPKKRELGFTISYLPTAALLIGGLIGALMAM
jgi:glutathione S-transferase